MAAADPFVELEQEGVPIHLWSTRRFRGVILLWVLEAPLDEGRSARALLPDLLTRGTRSSPGLAAMAARCEDLYGTELFSEATAIGDRQLLQFGLVTVSDSCAGGRPIFEEAVELLAEALHDPPLVEGRFRADHLEQERANLARSIEALSDDTGLHSFLRMMHVLHAGTPRALHHWGSAEEALALEEPAVRAAWEDATRRAPAHLLVAGDVSPEAASRAARRLAGDGPRRRSAGPVRPPRLPVRAARELRERRALSQSKLVMGFRVDPGLLEGSAARLFGDVLGGESHSRLFKRVREGESLAYGCSSAMLTEHATLVVQAGIDAGAAPRVRELVEAELARLAAEPPSEEELSLSRASLARDLQNLRDSPRASCGFRLAARLLGRPHVVEEALAAARAVTPAQISAVAAGCSLDTVFLLEGAGALSVPAGIAG